MDFLVQGKTLSGSDEKATGTYQTSHRLQIGSAVISACTIIFCMILVGVFVGWMFGWKQMDCG